MLKLTPVLLLTLALTACGDVPQDSRPTSAAAAVQAGAAEAQQPDAAVVYIDVRTPAEFASGHVTGSLNIPVEEMERRWQELEPYRDQQIVLYCRTGRRSGLAMDVLKSKGFKLLENGVNLDRMVARGLPVSTCPSAGMC
jgi:rhodanese-related sulfurtransferase